MHIDLTMYTRLGGSMAHLEFRNFSTSNDTYITCNILYKAETYQ